MGPTLRQSGHHRQHRRRPIQGLDLGFLVHAQHQGLFRRIHIQPHDVAHLVDELRIVAELERIDQMRFEPECLPDPPHGRFRQPGLLGHRRPRPVRGIGRLALKGVHHDLLDPHVIDGARSPWAGLVGQPVEPTRQKPLPPLTHRLRPHPNVSGHLLVGFTCRTTQHDATPLRQRLRGLCPPRPSLQRLALLISQHHCSHWTATFRHPPSLQLIN